MTIKFLLLGGGVLFFLEGGVEVPILFLWARGFFRCSAAQHTKTAKGLHKEWRD